MHNPNTAPGVFVLTGSVSRRQCAETVAAGTGMLGEALNAYHRRIGTAIRRAYARSFNLGETMRELHALDRLDGFQVR